MKALYVAGYYDESLAQLTIAEHHYAAKVEFVYYRAVILLAQGKTKEAVLYLEEALEENPKKVNAIRYLDKEAEQHPVFAEVLVRYKKKK